MSQIKDQISDVLNWGLGAYATVKELDIREAEAKNSATAQYENDQQPEAVQSNGKPVAQQGEVLGVKASTLLYAGLVVISLGGAFVLYKNVG